MHKWISKLPQEPITTDVMFTLIANAVALGIILVIINFIAGQIFEKPAKGKKDDHGTRLLMNSANLLFLCVGLTGLMMLVNNNIVRAFGITAAIALVRFRIKIDEKSSNGALLFAILAGMGCGMKEVGIAWAMTAVYGVLLLSLMVVFRYFRKAAREEDLREAQLAHQSASLPKNSKNKSRPFQSENNEE